jgi:hypothetical protein
VATLIKPAAIRLTTLLAIGLALGGCGSKQKGEVEEGQFVKAGSAVYQVQLTRLVNPEQRFDRQLLRGQTPLTPNEQYLAVFLRIENKGSKPYLPPQDLKVVDTVGNQYLPLNTIQSGFGLDFFEPIEPGDHAPLPDSPAAEGPDRGAMLLYRVKNESATDNLPLVLEIPSGGKSTVEITLDV